MKESVIKIAVAVVLLLIAVYIEHNFALPTWQLLLIYLVPYLVVGLDTIKEAIEGVMEGEPFDENFLMTIATLGALCIGFLPGAETQFPEAVFVMLFFQIGELFEGYAEGKSRESISHLMDIRPDTANVEREGKVVAIAPEEVAVGETIVIRPGEKVPLDGEIVEGQTSLNTVALTGESTPRDVVEGDEVISGCINISGLIRVRTSKTFGESTVSKIIQLVESASDHKSKSEAFITRFARIYTPIVVFAAIALALLPSLAASAEPLAMASSSKAPTISTNWQRSILSYSTRPAHSPKEFSPSLPCIPTNTTKNICCILPHTSNTTPPTPSLRLCAMPIRKPTMTDAAWKRSRKLPDMASRPRSMVARYAWATTR